MTQKHTPIPWTYRFRLQGTTIEPLDGEEELAIVWKTRGFGDIDANARFIVAAVNAHEELLAALRGLLATEYFVSAEYAESDACYWCPAKIVRDECTNPECPGVRARAAIAKATGPQAG